MRRFSVLLGATAPAVAAALTAFFAGLGLGSYLLGRLAPRFASPLRTFAALEFATALSALTVEPLLRFIEPLYEALYDVTGDRVALQLAVRVGVAVAVVLVPATFMGGTLPVLAQLVAARAQALGVRAGALYAVNTLGAAFGALAVPAILLPSLGAGGALVAAVATSVVIGAGALRLGRSGDRAIGRSGDREIGRSGDREIGRSGDREIGRSTDRNVESSRRTERSSSRKQRTPRTSELRSPHPPISRSPDPSISRSPDPSISRSPDPPIFRSPDLPISRSPESPTPRTLAFVSGVVTLALEALGTRAFALVHENSVYSFATVVAVFLAGLAGGAALARVALGRGTAARTLIALGWSAAGVWMIMLPALFVRMTGLEYVAGGALLGHEIRLAGLVAAGLLVPSVLLGMVLPALMQEQGNIGKQGGPAVGTIVAANTAGAIVGPAIALFALAPAAGLWAAISLLGAASIAAAVTAVGDASRTTQRAVVGAIAVGAIGFAATRPSSLPAMKLGDGERVLDVREGAFGSVAVVERDGHRRIKLNNFYVLGGTASAGDERLQGHIPLLLHPRPERVAYLGLGTGISLSAIRFHPVRDVVALELVPDVAAAAREWFGESNLGVLADSRVRVRAEDARSYVGATRERFDVVIGDLVVPWRRGESSLYTEESFTAVRRVLAPGGLYCQWVPLYQISEAEFDSIAATFLDVFPRASLWRDFNAGDAAIALIGHTAAAGLEANAADTRTRAMMTNPDRANPYLSHPAGLWMYFAGPLDPAQPPFRAAERNRDAHPWVELASPRLHLRIERREAGAFVGRRLKDRLDNLRSTPLAGTVAGSLTPEHIEWRERGAEIWEASLLSFEGDNAAADRLGLATLARLPIEIQTAVTGGPINK